MESPKDIQEKQQVEAWLKKATPRQLIDAIHAKYGAYVFFGVPGADMEKTEELPVNSFQTCFKAPTIAEALGMADFFKHSLIQTQMSNAETKMGKRELTDS